VTAEAFGASEWEWEWLAVTNQVGKGCDDIDAADGRKGVEVRVPFGEPGS
jgi:hypothetical protein